MQPLHARSLLLLGTAVALALAHAPLASRPVRAQAQIAPGFRVVVNPGVPHARLQRDFVANAFLRKVSRWGHGDAIKPVDQHGDSLARRRFSSDVLRRSVSAVRSYWQQLIFSGRGLPPPELASDAEVLHYVARHGGAIGYVSGSAEPSGVKVVSVD